MRWMCVLPCAISLWAQQPRRETISRAADRTGLALTLYHQGIAVIRDRRRIDLPLGSIRLALVDLSPKIRPKTALFEALGSMDVQSIEQNFEFDLLTPSTLAQGNIGQPVRLRWPGSSTSEGLLASLPVPADILPPPRTPLEAKLDPMPALWRAARIYRGRWAKIPRVRKDPNVLVSTPLGFESASPEALSFRTLPPGLRASPTLVESVDVKAGGSQEIQLTYLTEGLSWSVQYTGTYHPREDRMDLQAMVTLTNETGAAFPDARLQLVAGDPNFVPDPDPETIDPDVARLDMTTMSVAASRAPSFEEEKLTDYHLYTLDRPTTLAQGQTKQISLFRVEGIPVQRLHRADILNEGLPEELPRGEASAFITRMQSAESMTWEPLDVQAGLAWTNDETSGLGRPLPEGQFHLVESRPGGTLIPLEPQPFESLSRGERSECWAGAARSWTARRRMAKVHSTRKGLELTWEVNLHHRGSDPTALVLRQWMEPGWVMVRSDLPSERPSTHQVRFTIPVPPEGARQLAYTVRIPWQAKP